MYDRDVKAENKETLDRLVQAIERLAEIHAKDRKGEDNGNKELLDWLKKNNDGRATREVPTSDDRADVLRTTRGRISAAGGDGAQELDYTTINRINSMFRALQGDMGGFQRLLQSSLQWGDKASKLAESFTKTAGADTSEAEITLKEAKKQLLSRLTAEKGGSEGLSEYFKQLQPDASRIDYHRQHMSYDEALKQATKEKEEDLLQRARSQPRKPKEDNGLLVPPPPGSNTSNIDGAGLAKIVTTTITGMRLATLGTIEYNRGFQNLNANLATDYAMYNQKNLITDMKYARNISPAMQQLLQSEAAFKSTMEPIKSLGTSMSSSLLSGAVDAFDLLAKPISAVAKSINESGNAVKGIQEEALNKGGLGATLGAIAGGTVGFFAGGPFGALWGALEGAALGGAGGLAIGAAGEFAGGARRKELEKIIGDPDDKSKKGMIGTFANDLLSRPLAPPRKFIP